MHLEHLADAFLLGLGGVGDLSTGLNQTGVDAHEGELTEERVHGNLEGECCKRIIHGGLPHHNLGFVVHGMASNLTDVQRVGQVVNHGVEQRLHTLVVVCGTAQHGVDFGVDGHLPNGALDFVDGEFLATEILFHELFIGFCHCLQQLLPVFFGTLHQVSRDFLDDRFGANVNFTAPGDGVHVDKVHHAVEGVFGADGQLQHERLSPQAVNNGLHGEVEVCTQLVHLINKADARHIVFGGLTPHLLRLRFHAFFTVEHGNSTVEHPQRPLHLNGEVHVTRGVDDVDLVVLPETGHGSRGNGDTTLFFLLHPVGGGGTVVGFAHLTVDTGVEEDTLGCGGFTSIDVCHDANIADLGEVLKHFLRCHDIPI